MKHQYKAVILSHHWCVCSWKTVIGGLFDTIDEAQTFATQAITEGKEAISIHYVGGTPGQVESEMKKAWDIATADHTSRFPAVEQADAIEGYRQVGPC